jgi:DNA-binding transcriptional MerR regulator
MAVYLRSQIAKKAEVSIETLRYYEKRGLIEPERMENGYRIYPEDILARLQFIKRAKEAGFTLEETRQTLLLFSVLLKPEDISEMMVLGVRNKIQKIDAQIERLMEIRKVLLEIDEGIQKRHQCPSMQGLLKNRE